MNKTCNLLRLSTALGLWMMSVQCGYCFYSASTGRWLSRDPIGEPGFEALRRERPRILATGPDLYPLLANDPMNRADFLGLKDWEALIAAAEKAFETAAPGGDFAAALNVFNGCNSLGLALVWAKTQRDAELRAALIGDPATEYKRELEISKKWDKKINIMAKTYDAKCKGACYRNGYDSTASL
jgi:hypothetical protein